MHFIKFTHPKCCRKHRLWEKDQTWLAMCVLQFDCIKFTQRSSLVAQQVKELAFSLLWLRLLLSSRTSGWPKSGQEKNSLRKNTFYFSKVRITVPGIMTYELWPGASIAVQALKQTSVCASCSLPRMYSAGKIRIDTTRTRGSPGRERSYWRVIWDAC